MNVAQPHTGRPHRVKLRTRPQSVQHDISATLVNVANLTITVDDETLKGRGYVLSNVASQ